MTAAKSQQKQLPRYSDLDNESHWEQVQRTIQMAARKNKFLDNVVLRIHVDVRSPIDDGKDTVDVVDIESSQVQAGRAVCLQSVYLIIERNIKAKGSSCVDGRKCFQKEPRFFA